MRKAFGDLTRVGQARRLRQMALVALERYDLELRRVTTMSTDLNGVFRVDTTSGERFVLRITPPAWRSAAETHSEIAWLRALARETDIEPVQPLPNRAGEYITTVAVDGVPESRRCVLFSWVPGVPVAEALTEANVEAMGVLAARLHGFALGFQPDAGFSIPRLDRVFKSNDPVLIFQPEYAELFTPGQLAGIERAITHSQAALDRRFANPDGLRIIHGDFHHENVMVQRERLRPIDFDEICWGYPTQDISLTFYDFRYYTNPATHAYADLCAWFQRGYSQLLPWPEEYPGQIETFLIARRLWVTNWILGNADPRGDGSTGRWQRFLDQLLDAFNALPKSGESAQDGGRMSSTVTVTDGNASIVSD
jgi:Ser/Thr protein kinase RdoA (MazF antagonist)